MSYETIMLRQRVDQAMSERRMARLNLRLGNRVDHKEHMHGARFYLRLARQWKPKTSTPNFREAAE